MQQGFIAALYQYPVKSMAGLPCETALALTSGFEWDRRWMLIDEHNKMVTQRELPVLCQFFPHIIHNQLTIRHLNENCTIAVDEVIGSSFSARIWDDEASVFNTSKTMDKWLSEQLGKKVHLVKIAERFHYVSSLNLTTAVSGADGYPYLVIGTASMQQLTATYGTPVDIRRFRPNIVVSTAKPHEEDEWPGFATPAVNLQKVKPCLRCQVIDIDQDMGQKTGQVTKTLSTYRRMGNNIGFGANYLGLNDGMISVNDLLMV